MRRLAQSRHQQQEIAFHCSETVFASKLRYLAATASFYSSLCSPPPPLLSLSPSLRPFHLSFCLHLSSFVAAAWNKIRMTITPSRYQGLGLVRLEPRLQDLKILPVAPQKTHFHCFSPRSPSLQLVSPEQIDPQWTTFVSTRKRSPLRDLSTYETRYLLRGIELVRGCSRTRLVVSPVSTSTRIDRLIFIYLRTSTLQRSRYFRARCK